MKKFFFFSTWLQPCEVKKKDVVGKKSNDQQIKRSAINIAYDVNDKFI